MGRRLFQYPKTCPICGKNFLADKKDRTYCSYKCSAAVRAKPLAILTCVGCGRQFQVKRHRARQPEYCSHPCYLEHTAECFPIRTCLQCGKQYQKRNIGYCSMACVSASQRTRFLRNCLICNSPFEIVKSHADKGKGLYCSHKCAREDQKRQRIQCVCEHCHQPFEVIPSALKYREPRFCSYNCYLKFSGETTPERIVRESLASLNIRFEQERPVLTYHLDFFLPDFNIALEVDGDYWHRDKGVTDAHRDKTLTELGIHTIRVKESEIVASKDVRALIARKIGTENP